MKLKSMTSVIMKSALVLAACASLNAIAGPAPSGKNVVPPVEENGALFDTLGATLEVGYDTRYYFRGLWFSDNTVWAGLSLSVPLTEQLSLGVGALYTSTVDTLVDATAGGPELRQDYTELDLSTSLTYDAGFAKFGLVYTHYEFFNGFSGTFYGAAGAFTPAGELNVSSADEVGLTMALPLGPVNFYLGGFYDLRIGGSYLEAGVDYPIEVTSWLTLVPAIKSGYGFDYYTGGDNTAPAGAFLNQVPTSGFTHLGFSLSAPIKLTRTATLTPYIAYNISGRARRLLNSTDNEIYGGVKLGVTF
ncbi:MAG: hypothetical protein U0984_18845 [Prosthecobacter sp.]|nr:hypothetical protein [Prosthecobacter sp.]